MKKITLTVLTLLLIFSVSVSAQGDLKDRVAVKGKLKKEDVQAEELPNGWKKGGEGILNVSLTSFNRNWQSVSGGENNLLLTGTLGLFANYKKDKLTWNNKLTVAYGFVNFIDKEADNQFKIRKADDLLKFESKVGYGFSKKVYGITFLDFVSQFSPGYKYTSDSLGDHRDLVSKFMSPGVLRLGAGIDYRPCEYLSVLFAPLSFRGLFVTDQDIANKFIHGNAADATNPAIGKTFTAELGALLQAKFKKELVKNISWESDLDIFQNYLGGFDGTVLNWSNILSLKVNKFIATRLESTLAYNSKVDTDLTAVGLQAGLQHRLFLGVGFSYKF